MDLDGDISINEQVTIRRGEVRFRFVAGGGPGGQHANRSATQVELLFDVAGSPSLDPAQRERVQAALRGSIDARGTLRLVSQSTRSQYRNREDALGRFRRLLRAALRVPRARRPTRPTPASREARLEAKRRRSAIKARRRPLRESG